MIYATKEGVFLVIGESVYLWNGAVFEAVQVIDGPSVTPNLGTGGTDPT